MEDIKQIQEFFSKSLEENIVVRMYNLTDKTADLYKEDNPGLEFYLTGKEGQDYVRKYKDHISFPFSSHMNDGTPIPNYEENKEKLAAYLKQKGIPFKTTSAKPYRGVSRTTGKDFMYTTDTFKVPLSHVDIKDISLEETNLNEQADHVAPMVAKAYKAYIQAKKDGDGEKAYRYYSKKLNNTYSTRADRDAIEAILKKKYGSALKENKPVANVNRHIKAIQIQLDQLGVKYEMSGNPYKPFKAIYKPINKDDKWYDNFEDIVFRYNLGGVVKTSMDEANKFIKEGKQLDQVDFAKVVKAVEQTGHPVTVLLVPKFNEIEVLTGMNAPDDMLRDLSNAVDSLGYGRNDIFIAGDSSNLSRREYSDIRRVNGGAKDYFEEAIAEDDSYARVSKPRFIKDKNNPNFLNVYLDYDIGPGGNSMAFGKETMTGQIRRLSSAKARKVAHDIALDLEANFNLEDIEVTDLENGKVRIFAVSDDFIDMDPNMLSEIKESLNPEVSKAVNRFIKAMAKRYDYSEQDAVYAIMSALRQENFQGLNEMDLNDPVMMKMRAAKDKLAKMRAANSGGDGNDKYFKKSTANLKKLSALKQKRAQIMRDMEQEAELEGGPIADRYGDMLNKLDKAIAMLQGQGEWGPEKDVDITAQEIAKRAAMLGLEEDKGLKEKFQTWLENNGTTVQMAGLLSTLLAGLYRHPEMLERILSMFGLNEDKIEVDDKTEFKLDLKHLLDKHVVEQGYSLTKEHETDPNLELKVGDYQTQHFHMCPGAKSLYQDIEDKVEDMGLAIRSAKLQDALFAMEESALENGANEADVFAAETIADQIMAMAAMMGLDKEHSYIQGHVDKIKGAVDKNQVAEASKGALNYFNDLKYYYQKAFRYLDIEEREEYKQLAKDFFSRLQIDNKVRPVGLEESSSSEEKRIAKRAIKSIAKYRGVSEDEARNDLIRAAKELGSLKEDMSLDDQAKAYYLAKVKRGEIDTLPEDPKAAFLAQMMKDQMGHDEETLRRERGLEEKAAYIAETIKLGMMVNEDLCEKGKRYIKARQAAGEKSSAYLSGRAVRVCKGQIEWPKKGKKKK